MLGIENPTYLDLGANHPHHSSNTALLYAHGARGINVEANPQLIAHFMKARPEDVNLNCAVGVSQHEARPFHISTMSSLSSLHADLVDDIDETIMVKTWTLQDFIDGHNDGKWPDFLNIDIEGEDLAVMEQSLPSSGDRPSVVCVEYMRIVTDSSDQWQALMPERNYQLLLRTRSNMIWVTNEAMQILTG